MKLTLSLHKISYQALFGFQFYTNSFHCVSLLNVNFDFQCWSLHFNRKNTNNELPHFEKVVNKLIMYPNETNLKHVETEAIFFMSPF